jgi:hypothetical protein
MHTFVCSEVVGACTYNGGIWLESKVGEHGVLTWRGRDAGDDPFTDEYLPGGEEMQGMIHSQMIVRQQHPIPEILLDEEEARGRATKRLV